MLVARQGRRHRSRARATYVSDVNVALIKGTRDLRKRRQCRVDLERLRACALLVVDSGLPSSRPVVI
jgi:hypothetical protein